MNIHELGILIAYFIKFSIGADVALLVRADSRRPVGWSRAGANPLRRARTACVTLMQAQAEAGYAAADYYIYTTADPSPMCLGMARRCHVTHIFFIDNRAIKFSTWRDSSTLTAHNLTAELRGMIAGQWAAENPWRDREAYLRSHGLASVATTISTANAVAFNIWIASLSEIREVAFVWLTLPHGREILPVPPPKLVRVPANIAYGRPASRLRDKIYMTLAFAIVHCLRPGGPAPVAGQLIGAILVGPDGTLLAWGVNTGAANVTRHAETNCVQRYMALTGQGIPDHCTLYTTLRSCDMCAGMLATVARSLRVVYGAPDPEVHNTALSVGLNNSVEQRFAGSDSNPVARANFQRLIAKLMLRNYEAHVKTVKAQIVKSYNPPATASAASASTSSSSSSVPTKEERAALGRAQNAAKNLYVDTAVADYRRQHPSRVAGFDTRALPRAITNALASPLSMANIAGYYQLFRELGLMMVIRAHYLVDQDVPDEVVLRARHDERAMPIITQMRGADMEVWLVARRLLVLIALTPVTQD